MRYVLDTVILQTRPDDRGQSDLKMRGFRDTGYLPFYFQGYRILSILLPGIWDTVFNILVTFRDIDYLGKLIMGIFADSKGILACLLQGIWDIWYPPIQASKMVCDTRPSKVAYTYQIWDSYLQ